MRDRLFAGEPATGGESGRAWFGTYDGRPVVVKRGEAEARPRLEAIASLLDRLRRRGRHEPMRAYSPEPRRSSSMPKRAVPAVDVISVPRSDVVRLDLHPANTLVHAGRLSGIIDWDGVVPGDRWFDLVYFAHHVELRRSDDALTSWI